MVDKIINKIRIVLVVLLIFSILIPVASSNEILGIDISISQNPIPCGGAATVTATIKRAPLNRGQLPLGGIVKLWDYDTGFNDGDDLLDQSNMVLWFDQNTVTFTLRCDSKEGGCDLYGPSGQSWESGTDIYVSFYGHKSAKINVKCQQIDVEGEIAIYGSDDVIVGDETSITMFAEQAVENVTDAKFNVIYDSSVFEITNIELINPVLQVKEAEGLFSYDINALGLISFNLSENITPITIDGPIAKMDFLVKNDSPVIWDTTNIKMKADSAFYNELNEKIDVCLGGNCSVFIAPDDITVPIINHDLISFTQGKIVGSSNSITDDFDSYENYLTVCLYDENDELIAEDFVTEDGSFQLDNFFWLNNESSSNLIVYNGVNLSTSYSFIPLNTCIPYVLQNYQTYNQNNTGKPGDIVQLGFEILGNSAVTETYDFTVTNTEGWNIEQPTFQQTLEPMENKTITINVTIPTTAENNTKNTITLKMASRAYPENSDSESVVLSVVGSYEKSAPAEKTPGFEMILLIILMVIFILISKRKKKLQ